MLLVEFVIILLHLRFALFFFIVFLLWVQFIVVISQVSVLILSSVVELAIRTELNSRRRNVLPLLVVVASKLIESLVVKVVALWIKVVAGRQDVESVGIELAFATGIELYDLILVKFTRRLQKDWTIHLMSMSRFH